MSGDMKFPVCWDMPASASSLSPPEGQEKMEENNNYCYSKGGAREMTWCLLHKSGDLSSDSAKSQVWWVHICNPSSSGVKTDKSLELTGQVS